MGLVFAPRVRETSITVGTGNIVLLGRMFGSIAFADKLQVGDTCDIVISYGDTFEECVATLNADGELERGSVYLSLHANGALDQNHVSFGPGTKTVILSPASGRFATLEAGAVRFNAAQALSTPQKAQAQANLGLFPPGTAMPFVQTNAPVGWLKDTGFNDRALRITSGTVGAGGSVGFSTLFARTKVDGHTLIVNEVPIIVPAGSVSAPGITINDFKFTVIGVTTGPTGLVVANGGNSIGLEGAASTPVFTGAAFGAGHPHDHTLDMRLTYVDAIVAIKQ